MCFFIRVILYLCMLISKPNALQTMNVMRKTFISALVLWVFITGDHILFAQEANKIHWASSVEYEFHGYEEEGWSVDAILGAPDAFPPGALNKNAFRMRNDTCFAKVLLSYREPVHAQQLILVENNDPGRIVKVRITDMEGYHYTVYQNESYRLNEDFRTLVLNFPRTAHPVQYVEVSLNTIPAPGLSQIDAVGIIDDPDIDNVERQLFGANYNIKQELSYLSKKEPLPEEVNSPFPELKPVFSHDGHELFFTRVSHPENANGARDPQDIFVATKNGDDQWSKAENAGSALNNKYANGICSVVNPSTLLVLNTYQGKGKKNMGAATVERKHDSAWDAPSNLDIEFFYNLNKHQDYFLSADEQAIVMALERSDSYGELDLYVSVKQGDDFYSSPINLGGKINTSEMEFAPFLSKDGTTLYFSSEGHRGFGNSDIYKCERLDNTWANWSEPQNLGPAVNTEFWEAYFTISPDNKFAYFVSNDGSENGDEDIYRIPLINDVKPQEAEPYLVMKTEILNEETNEPVAADISLKNKTTEDVYYPVTREVAGSYEVYPELGFDYTLTAKARGYMPYKEEVNLSAVDNDEDIIQKQIYLTPIKVGSKVIFENLLFDQGTAEMLDSSEPDLDKLKALLADNPGLVIELGGHTDRVGSRNALQELSEERVNVVKQYLVESGVDPNQIVTVGYGGSEPIAPNDTEENRAKNRRVEVKILAY